MNKSDRVQEMREALAEFERRESVKRAFMSGAKGVRQETRTVTCRGSRKMEWRLHILHPDGSVTIEEWQQE
jgi:hypothetical protein